MKVINKAKIPIYSWCDDIESSAIEQAVNCANHPNAFHHIALMPDSHAGFGCPIGSVVALKDNICPSLVGVDVGCGMIASKISLIDELVTEKGKSIIGNVRRNIPMGFSRQSNDKLRAHAEDLMKLPIASYELITLEEVYTSLATLGGGNHFVELQVDSSSNVWVMIHSGSRHLGKTVCDKYNRIAQEMMTADIPNKDLAVLRADSEHGCNYITDMQFCLEFAALNRQLMMDAVVDVLQRTFKDMEVKVLKTVSIHHNFTKKEKHFGEDVWVHRKGATKADVGLAGIIPGSMGSMSYITKGKGCELSFNSCSHGAGRNCSRGDAKRKFSLDEFKSSMEGVVSCDIDGAHLDESPMAYKDISVVMNSQKDLTDIECELIPIVNLKG